MYILIIIGCLVLFVLCIILCIVCKVHCKNKSTSNNNSNSINSDNNNSNNNNNTINNNTNNSNINQNRVEPPSTVSNSKSLAVGSNGYKVKNSSNISYPPLPDEELHPLKSQSVVNKVFVVAKEEMEGEANEIGNINNTDQIAMAGPGISKIINKSQRQYRPKPPPGSKRSRPQNLVQNGDAMGNNNKIIDMQIDDRNTSSDDSEKLFAAPPKSTTHINT